MSEPFIGEIKMFGGNFAPRGYAFCDGQLLLIEQNQALFAILGTIYGGNGRTTLGLPDLRGRVPMHKGNGSGLTPRQLGQKGGAEEVTLNATQIPAHSHTAQAEVTTNCSKGAGNADSPSDSYWAGSSEGDQVYDVTAGAKMKDDAVEVDVSVANAGGGQSHTNVQPFQCVNFIIALQGVFPSRN